MENNETTIRGNRPTWLNHRVCIFLLAVASVIIIALLLERSAFNGPGTPPQTPKGVSLEDKARCETYVKTAEQHAKSRNTVSGNGFTLNYVQKVFYSPAIDSCAYYGLERFYIGTSTSPDSVVFYIVDILTRELLVTSISDYKEFFPKSYGFEQSQVRYYETGDSEYLKEK